MKFEQIKQELAQRVKSTKYFTRQFYKMYVSCLNARRAAIENDIDESYLLAPGVIGYHSYTPIYNSRFYNENSCAYCEFLAIVCGRI